MIVKQLSIFVENKSGRLCDITELFKNAGIDIRALSIADTTDYGILRVIVNKTAEAEKALKENGFTYSVTEVIAAAVPDEPGGLNKAIMCLSKENISIEYVYAFLNPKKGTAFIIMRVDDNQKASDILTSNGIEMMTDEEIRSL